MKLVKSFINYISPNLAKNIRNVELKRLLKCSPQFTVDGMKFLGAQNYDNYEPKIFNVLNQIIIKCNVFVNVGANHGIYCLKFAKAVDRVFAFEALPNNLNFIYRNIRLNDLASKIFVFPVAIASTSGLATFYGASTGGSLLKGWNQQVDDGIDVPKFSLDFLIGPSLMGTKPLFLIDVEGAEFEVIKGAHKIIESLPDAIFCIEIPCKEFMPNASFNPNFVSIFEFFYAAGFLSYEIDEYGALIPIYLSKVRQYCNQQRYNGLMAVFSKSPI